MTSVNLLSTTADGQQVFLTSTGQHILTTAEPANIIYTENPGAKTIVLQDTTSLENVENPQVEYTLIEDPNSGGGLLQIANAGGQNPGNIVLSQDFFDVINDVNLQESFPTNEVIEKKTEKEIKLEKPIGKGS